MAMFGCLFFSWGGDIPISPIPRMIPQSINTFLVRAGHQPHSFGDNLGGYPSSRSCSQNIAPSCPQNQPIYNHYITHFVGGITLGIYLQYSPKANQLLPVDSRICRNEVPIFPTSCTSQLRNHDALPKVGPKVTSSKCMMK